MTTEVSIPPPAKVTLMGDTAQARATPTATTRLPLRRRPIQYSSATVPASARLFSTSATLGSARWPSSQDPDIKAV